MAKKRDGIIYVPILKTKAGDRWALSHLQPTTRDRVQPLLELHPHKKKSDDEQILSVCEALVADWGTDRPFYLDGVWLHGESGDAAILESVFTGTEDYGLCAIPVIRPSFSAASSAQAAAIIAGLGRGCLLRIGPKTPPAAINAIVAAVGAKRGDVDLMIDYAQQGMSLTAGLPKLPHIADWRGLIAASGTFPISLQHIGLNNWTMIPRGCWQTYSHAVASGKLSRTPTFSDYTMRAPGPPADFGAPSVNLRYTLENDWLAQLGGKFKEGASGEMHDFCAQLIGCPEYRGDDFSDGDAEILRVADPDAGSGNPTQWLQWCVNHHIETVVDQLTAT